MRLHNLHMMLLSFVCLVLSFLSLAQDANTYDKALAEKLGADDYGMKSYVMVTLITGNAKNLSEEETKAAFAGHFSNMSKLAEEGKLVVSGPYVDARPKRGFFIFNTVSIDEAEEWVKTDPAIISGLLDYQLDKVYSSAALMTVADTHKTLSKQDAN